MNYNDYYIKQAEGYYNFPKKNQRGAGLGAIFRNRWIIPLIKPTVEELAKSEVVQDDNVVMRGKGIKASKPLKNIIILKKRKGIKKRTLDIFDNNAIS